ncbi:MAG: hypothetical protein ACRCWJ_15150 [Casimicrobium sp.]
MADSHNLTFEMGKISGQLRELIQSTNQNTQQLNALALLVAANSSLPDDVAALRTRVTNLEVEKNKADGRTGVLAAVYKSPTTLWIIAAVGGVWAILTGKIPL